MHRRSSSRRRLRTFSGGGADLQSFAEPAKLVPPWVTTAQAILIGAVGNHISDHRIATTERGRAAIFSVAVVARGDRAQSMVRHARLACRVVALPGLSATHPAARTVCRAVR
jgi:hypothetical protein